MRTFDTKQEAQQWARRMESDLDSGKRILFLETPEAQTLTLRAALERYREEKTVNKAGTEQESRRNDRWFEHALADKLLHQIVPGGYREASGCAPACQRRLNSAPLCRYFVGVNLTHPDLWSCSRS